MGILKLSSHIPELKISHPRLIETETDQETRIVKTFTLDNILKDDFSHPNLLKFDFDGAELKVFAGAEKIP